MKSYAQDKEDIILKLMLHNVKWGHYIDVGANHPSTYSVTKLFYDEGWTGVNVEPLPDMFKLLCEERPNDTSIHAGCGKSPATLKLYIDGMGSSFNELKNKPRVDVPVITLTNIFRNHCEDWSDIHFCKIDVEGYEREVLEGIEDWEEFRPWVFCIESTLPGTDIPCYDKWEDILLDNEYALAFAHGINRYYYDTRRIL